MKKIKFMNCYDKSNASIFILYHYMLREAEWEFFRLNQKAAIFDSSPGRTVRPHKLVRGISDLVYHEVPVSPICYAVSGVLVGGACVYHATHCTPLRENYYANALATLKDDKRLVPHLFLYPAKDKLVSSKKVAKFAALKREQGNYVRERVYDNCEHVTILVKHPDDYVSQIEKHLEVCQVDIKNILTNYKHTYWVNFISKMQAILLRDSFKSKLKTF